MARIAEGVGERGRIEAQQDDARRAAQRMSELSGEPLEYLDIFTFDPRWIRALPNYGLDRVPKCMKPRPLKPKEKE